jgi:hypothetical protein
MIRLSKVGIPKVLAQRGDRWARVLRLRIERGQRPKVSEIDRYKHPEIKEALILETSGKCAYCESKLTHIAFGHIEHVAPKSRRPDLAFDWENLTLACELCNTKKGVREDLIDPYVDYPDHHLIFHEAYVFVLPGSDKGLLSQRILDLNRAGLVEQRRDALRALDGLLDRIARTKNSEVRAILKAELEKLAKDKSREYSAMTDAFVQRTISAFETTKLLPQA